MRIRKTLIAWIIMLLYWVVVTGVVWLTWPYGIIIIPVAGIVYSAVVFAMAMAYYTTA